ncbi:MAG: hypothetical protein A2782_02055 [Candidatus Blackburnbacteria bacterium RIFCSPHIGHO2_01_FULL_43_15b]|uniref:Fibronectin type-III domain-containing protein n=1 Tax=Candidatus Blackburnbacteria bacterium RIFCSPHIGHO2_01_FULL_43_15b TaxID=1797513 RepID=A0A1G1UY45_9BACT|nr:MAG: hypothetical protein A2782_02055 [Candidatus Blackburnbacteria bacterium RIFCSPHIGHO2_01_FULL_43_15b]
MTTSTAGQATLAATSSWYNTSWAYRRKITFDNSAQAENLTNFPVLVKLDSTRINYSNTQDSGQDIRFTDSDGTTLLSYEIEKWDETGTSWVWVKVPQIDINSSTDYIYLYYGNTSATDGQTATSVWDSNYQLVQHLKETSGTTTSDSTSNSNNGTKVSATEPNPATSGQVDGAQDFDGNNDYLEKTNASFAQTPGAVSLWFKADTINTEGVDTYQKMTLMQYGDIYWGFQISSSTNKIQYHYYDGAIRDWYSNSTISTGQWYKLDVVSTVSGSEMFLNGASQGASSLTLFNNICGSTCNLDIGGKIAGYPSGDSFDGLIDEIRISNTRSAAWIAASYKSEADTFNTFASEEQVYSTTPGTLTSSIFDSEFSAGAAWGTLTYNATTPSNTSVSVKARTSNSSSMTGATAFSSCTAITSGADISSNSCVTDSHRYIQYQLSLANTDSVSTPTFQDISIAFSAYDTTPPSISLTALTPDPNSDSTPTLSGTATESIGTVSNVQFQMDSTSGSWTACTASDGSFNSASEAFSCTSATLTDGSHTMYVRATDSNGNTTSSSYASDSFTIDATTPVSIDLDSPGDNSYTNSERPTFKWKATTDATAGLSKYVLEVDNPSAGSGQASGDFTIDNIPTSGTTDITSNNKYVIHFDGFSDSDSTNNYISVYTRSTSDWGSSENDGKLREGRVSWKVKAVDNAGNETSSSRTLLVDRNSSKVELTQINDVPFSSTNFSTTDKTPTVFGKITDSLSGGDSSQTQDENGPKIASSPKQVDIKVEKKEGLTYKLHTLYTINMDKPWYTCDGKEVSDNSKQKCDKYLPFEYTLKDTLDLGTYKITLTGKDKADNSSSETSFTLNITTLSQIITPEEKKTIEEEMKELPKEEQEKVKEELEITKPVEPSALEKAGEKVAQTSKNILNTTGNFISSIFSGIGQGVKFAVDTTGKALAFVGDKTGQALAFVGQGIGSGANAVGQGLAFAGEKIGQGISNAGKAASNGAVAIGDGYNQLANNAPGVTKTILTGIGNGVSTTGNTIANVSNSIASTTSTVAQNTSRTVENIANTLAKTTGDIAQKTGSTIAQATQNTVNATKEGLANIAFSLGEKTQGVSDSLGYSIVQIGYLFVNEPTKISDVKVEALTPTSAKISWVTNRPANGKVNYGLDETYPLDIQSEKRITNHEFTLTNLKPDTQYYFEVMSHNKNYVYDANRKFKTPTK